MSIFVLCRFVSSCGHRLTPCKVRRPNSDDEARVVRDRLGPSPDASCRMPRRRPHLFQVPRLRNWAVLKVTLYAAAERQGFTFVHLRTLSFMPPVGRCVDFPHFLLALPAC